MVLPPLVLLRSSSGPLDGVDRLENNEESDLEVMNSIRNRAHAKIYVSKESDTDEDGIM